MVKSRLVYSHSFTLTLPAIPTKPNGLAPLASSMPVEGVRAGAERQSLRIGTGQQNH
ncbi:hypothetical protein Pla111_05480 [Botrimarina hoheduenensis]|uniref:Uncharacterized protein n=1 Tax=Botrimarina hoheduenensis TaxID=2528000 RepID=A0A5C5WFC1_9BACT|nr:hypothetical protein Pla111_05480 [Botrimarina hoheduenensis]